jgi:hypothetical protein
MIEIFNTFSSDSNGNAECIGFVEFRIEELIHKGDQQMLLGLPKQRGSVIVKCSIIPDTRDELIANFSCNNLINPNPGFFSGKLNPFILLSRMDQNGSFLPIWRSYQVQGTSNPSWNLHNKPCNIPLATLCCNNYDTPFRIELFSFGINEQHTFLGKVETTVQSILETTSLNDDKTITLRLEGKNEHSKDKNCGTFTISQPYIDKKATFLQVSSSFFSLPS